jgi:hypothetical protein
VYSHSSTADIDCLLGHLCMMTPGLEDKVPAAASMWHDFVDRRSGSSEILTFKTLLSLLSSLTSVVKLVTSKELLDQINL